MATRLKRIRINEVSLVDKPANKLSQVVLMKRHDAEGEIPMYGSEDMSIDQMIEKCGMIAEEILQTKAETLRKREPHLSEAQAFAKVYSDPANMHLRRAEREKNGFVRYVSKSLPPVARLEPLVERDMAMDGLKRLADEIRRSNPFLTPEQAFTKAYTDPANAALMRQERAASRAALGVTV